MIDEQRVIGLMIAIGEATDKACKKNLRLNKSTNAEKTKAYARMAASAGAIADPDDPKAGLEFVVNEFFMALNECAEKAGIDLRSLGNVMEVKK